MANENGSRRKRRRFFLCGICNVVSIAKNTANEADDTENTVHIDREKRFSSVPEVRNKDTEHSLHKDTSDSSLNSRHPSSRDDEGTKLKELTQNQSLSQTMVSSYGEEMETFGKVKEKICWNECLKELKNFEGDNDGKIIEDSNDRCFISIKASQKILEQENLEEISSKGEMTSYPSEALVDGFGIKKDGGRQKKNSSPKDLETFSAAREHILESFESTETHFATVNENLTSCSEEASNVPDIKINGAELKHAWLEEKQPLPGNRWKRIVALGTSLSHGKKLQRDSATINEEYELVVSTLKEYGVL